MKVERFLTYHGRRMLRCFRLTHFDLTFKYGKLSKRDYMEVRVDTTYPNAKIVYGKRIVQAFRKKDYEFILKVLCHEICHCLTGQITCFFKPTNLRVKTEEQVTEQISRVYYRLYRKEKQDELQS